MSKPLMIFAGNPGSGKSTLLNSIAKRVIFPSGVSLGQGKTAELCLTELDHVTLADTPGLSDVSLRAEAAAAIRDGLSSADQASIYFVVTLEAGRVRPVDVTTMNTVLDAIVGVDMTNKFGIIVNKLKPKVIEKIQNDINGQTKLFGCLTQQHKTIHIYLNPFDPELDEEDDALVPASEDLRLFLRTVLPTPIPQVKELEVDNYDGQTEMMEQMITRMMEAHNAQIAMLQQEIASMRAQAEAETRRKNQPRSPLDFLLDIGQVVCPPIGMLRVAKDLIV